MLHGGTGTAHLRIESRSPLVETPMAAATPAPAIDPPSVILILDADAGAAQVTRAGVERAVAGASVTVVATPEAAWSSAHRRPPHVLIIDPTPAELASVWLIENIKVAYPGIHIIVLASGPTRSLRRNGHRSAVDVFLDKPVPLPILVQAVRTALRDDIRPTPG